MAEYITKRRIIDARKIARLGASSGYFQLEDGSVTNFPDVDQDVSVGDYLIYQDGKPHSLMLSTEFEMFAMPLPEDLNPLHVENMIAGREFMVTENLTLCVLTLLDGRRVSGQDNAPNGSEEERKELAYHNAFNELIKLEIWDLQAMQALRKECENE